VFFSHRAHLSYCFHHLSWARKRKKKDQWIKNFVTKLDELCSVSGQTYSNIGQLDQAPLWELEQ
jgi:hypothetical protein